MHRHFHYPRTNRHVLGIAAIANRPLRLRCRLNGDVGNHTGRAIRRFSNKLETTVEEPLLRFAEIPWTEIAPGAREKAFQSNFKTVRLLQLSPGFEESDWCRRQHIGFVLAGSLEIRFANRVVVYQQGDGISIAAGEISQHRAIVGEEPVTMFLIDPH